MPGADGLPPQTGAGQHICESIFPGNMIIWNYRYGPAWTFRSARQIWLIPVKEFHCRIQTGSSGTVRSTGFGPAVPERVMLIRAEKERDRAAVHDLNRSAFETSLEADLVNALREQAQPAVSLVAEDGGVVIGHIMFSPVSLPDYPGSKIMGLAPMAVATDRRGKGIGSALVRFGLERCRQMGFGAVVVLGHPVYYPCFGFTPASRFGIGCEYEAPDEAFMVMELHPGYLRGLSGTVKYHPAFQNAG